MNARLGFDAWTWLIDWTVIVANLATVMLALLPGTVGPNRFGTDPRAGLNRRGQELTDLGNGGG